MASKKEILNHIEIVKVNLKSCFLKSLVAIALFFSSYGSTTLSAQTPPTFDWSYVYYCDAFQYDVYIDVSDIGTFGPLEVLNNGQSVQVITQPGSYFIPTPGWNLGFGCGIGVTLNSVSGEFFGAACYSTQPYCGQDCESAVPIAGLGNVDQNSCMPGNGVTTYLMHDVFEYNLSCTSSPPSSFGNYIRYFSWTAPITSGIGDPFALNFEQEAPPFGNTVLDIEVYTNGCQSLVDCSIGSGILNGLTQGEDYTFIISFSDPGLFDFPDFCLSIAPVPTIGEWGLLCLMLCFLSFGLVALRVEMSSIGVVEE